MKNLKVANKLYLGFAIIIALAINVGIFGIIGTKKMSNAGIDMYENQTKSISDMAYIMEYSQNMRILIRNLAISDINTELIETTEKSINKNAQNLETYMSDYETLSTSAEAFSAYKEAADFYINSFKPIVNEIIEAAKRNEKDTIVVKMNSITIGTAKMIEDYSKCMEWCMLDAENTGKNNKMLENTMVILIVVVLVAATLIAIVLALYISNLISIPISSMNKFLNRLVATGNIRLDKKDVDAIGKYARHKDEIGDCVNAVSSMVGRLNIISEKLTKVSDGDLTITVDVLSDKDEMGIAIQKMMNNLESIFNELHLASGQVSAASGQIAQASQMLATGSSQQASSIDEFSSSIAALMAKTQSNAENSAKIQKVNDQSEKMIEESIKSMGEMLTSMKEIEESSKNITKVIKVIDDIAFQTNILALNAAVEAARAGTHGKGFAVVAEEVRSLASKSSEAAKETAALIEGSSRKVEEGNQIVMKTDKGLVAVVESSKENTKLIKEMTISSNEQADTIKEVNTSIRQISNVVQENSATAEQSAASAEEMAAQSDSLNKILTKFKINEHERKIEPKINMNFVEKQEDNKYNY